MEINIEMCLILVALVLCSTCILNYSDYSTCFWIIIGIVFIGFGGLPASIGLGVVDGLRSKYIIIDCNISTKSTDVIFEGVTFVIIDVLQIISYFVFICYFLKYMDNEGEKNFFKKTDASTEKRSRYICYFLKNMYDERKDNKEAKDRCQSSKDDEAKAKDKEDRQKCAYWTCIIVIICIPFAVMCILTFAAPILGLFRDMNHIRNCKNESQVVDLIMWLNIFTKLFVLAATSTERLFVAILISMSIYEWLSRLLEMDTEAASKIEMDTEAASKIEMDTKAASKVDEQFYTLYNNYIRVGKRTKIRCEIFEAWFVVQYCVYLLSLLIEIIHLLKPLYHDKKFDNYDLIHSALYLIFDLIAFIIPYSVGVWLNYSHEKCYKKMLEACFKVKINTLLFEPGHDWKDANSNKLYMEYYNLMSAKNLAKRTDFDFVPSVLGISIPLDSQGYTFSILISIVSIVFNFAFL